MLGSTRTPSSGWHQPVVVHLVWPNNEVSQEPQTGSDQEDPPHRLTTPEARSREKQQDCAWNGPEGRHSVPRKVLKERIGTWNRLRLGELSQAPERTESEDGVRCYEDGEHLNGHDHEAARRPRVHRCLGYRRGCRSVHVLPNEMRVSCGAQLECSQM